MAGTIAAVCGLFGSLIRPVGGYVADRLGGLRTLYYALPVIVGSVVAVTSPSLPVAVAMMALATGAMGFGNGVVFQLVAEWFPKDIGLASGVVGAAGGFGGFLLPIDHRNHEGIYRELRYGSLALRRIWGVRLGDGNRRIAESGRLCGRIVFLKGYFVDGGRRKNHVTSAKLNDKLTLH